MSDGISKEALKRQIQAETAAYQWNSRAAYLAGVIEKLGFWLEQQVPTSILSAEQSERFAAHESLGAAIAKLKAALKYARKQESEQTAIAEKEA